MHALITDISGFSQKEIQQIWEKAKEIAAERGEHAPTTLKIIVEQIREQKKTG